MKELYKKCVYVIGMVPEMLCHRYIGDVFGVVTVDVAFYLFCCIFGSA